MSIKKYLPSKKFTKVILGLLCIIVLFIIFARFVKNKKNFSPLSKQAKVLVVSDAVEKDTDGDGLKDWEENLWGTDSNNPDSDGDGILDGEEIQKIRRELDSINLGEAPLQQDTTKTGELTRDILTIANAVVQSGALTQESGESVANEIANYIAKRDVTVHTIADFTIKENPTQAELRAYALLLKQSVETKGVSTRDVQLISEYEKNMETNNMSPYIQVGERVNKEIQYLKKITVPENYIIIHSTYVNSLEGISQFYFDLAKQDEDPVKALSALSAAPQIFGEYQKALELMK